MKGGIEGGGEETLEFLGVETVHGLVVLNGDVADVR
jgi:hypothetical protein